MCPPRPEGTLFQGEVREDQELHRHRCTLRGPGEPGDLSKDPRTAARAARRRGPRDVGCPRDHHSQISSHSFVGSGSLSAQRRWVRFANLTTFGTSGTSGTATFWALGTALASGEPVKITGLA